MLEHLLLTENNRTTQYYYWFDVNLPYNIPGDTDNRNNRYMLFNKKDNCGYIMIT